jgi:hypothetical protein
MTTAIQHGGIRFHFANNIDMKRLNSFFILFFISAVVIAQTNGITKLPESYRTPLSDMVYDDQSEWRSEPEEENPWREKSEEPLIKPRLKVELFPKYNYDSLQNPVSDSLFQNQNEIERPVSNILEYKFK